MNPKEAIHVLRNFTFTHRSPRYTKMCQACELAIRALREQPIK